MADSSERHDPSEGCNKNASVIQHVKALRDVECELEEWDCSDSDFINDVDESIEKVLVGHPLHSAVVRLRPYYPGNRLPILARPYWQSFLGFTREKLLSRKVVREARAEKNKLLNWVNDEISRLEDIAYPVEVNTVGDLLNALTESKTIAESSKSSDLERLLGLCDEEGGKLDEAIRKLIARTAGAMKLERRQIRDMQLAEFVASVIGGKRKRKRSPPKKPGPKFKNTKLDSQIWNIKKNSGLLAKDIANELNISVEEVRRSLDRERKRRKKAKASE